MGHPDFCALALPWIDFRNFVLRLGALHAKCFPVCPGQHAQVLTVALGEGTRE